MWVSESDGNGRSHLIDGLAGERFRVVAGTEHGFADLTGIVTAG